MSSPLGIASLIKTRKNVDLILPQSASMYEQQLKSISQPVLVIMGTEDQFTTVANGQEIVKDRKERTLITFEGNHLGGFPKMTKDSFGDLYAQALTRFFENEKIK